MKIVGYKFRCGCRIRSVQLKHRMTNQARTATELIAAAPDSSSPTTAGSPRDQRTSSCTTGASISDRPTVVPKVVSTASPLTRSRCVPVQQYETQLTGLVQAAAQGDRLRLHHRRRIRQLRTENEPAQILSKISISEVSPRFDDLNVLYHLYQFTTHKLEE